MGKTLVALEYSILALVVSAIFFWSATKNRLDDWGLAELFVASLLLLATCTAFAVVMKSIADLVLSNRMTMIEAKAWSSTRAIGKRNYIVNALIICGIPILAGIVASEMIWYPSEIIGHFVIPCITSAFCIGAMADIVWNYQEWVYSRERGVERPQSILSKFLAKP